MQHSRRSPGSGTATWGVGVGAVFTYLVLIRYAHSQPCNVHTSQRFVGQTSLRGGDTDRGGGRNKCGEEGTSIRASCSRSRKCGTQSTHRRCQLGKEREA